MNFYKYLELKEKLEAEDRTMLTQKDLRKLTKQHYHDHSIREMVDAGALPEPTKVGAILMFIPKETVTHIKTYVSGRFGIGRTIID